MRRGDEAHIGTLGAGAAQKLKSLVLQQPQQLHLHRQGEVANLIEKERASGRQLYPARFPRRGAGEGTFLVAEELGLEQRLGEGGAMHLDEGALGPPRQSVEEVGGDVFAHAAFPAEKHGGVSRGDTPQKRQGFLHRRRNGHQPLLAGIGPTRFLGLGPRARQSLADGVENLVAVEGLDDEVRRPGLHRLHCHGNGAVGRHEDDGRLRVSLAHPLQELQAVHSGRHAQVRYHQVKKGPAQLLQCGGAAAHRHRGDAVLCQEGAQHLAHGRVVVNDEHAGVIEGHFALPSS